MVAVASSPKVSLGTNLRRNLHFLLSAMAPKSKKSRAVSSKRAPFSKDSKRTVSDSLEPSSTVTGVVDELFEKGRRKLRRRDSDDRVDRVLLKKLKPNFDDATIVGSPSKFTIRHVFIVVLHVPFHDCKPLQNAGFS